MSNASVTISPVVKAVTVAPVQKVVSISNVSTIPTGAAGGDLTGAYPNPTVAPGAITLANLQDISTATLIGRAGIGTGAVEQIGVTSDLLLDPLAFTLGFADRSARSVIGRSAGTNGAPADIVAGTDGHVLRRASGTLGFGTIPSGSVTAPGSSGQVMLNTSGAFAGDAALTFATATDTLTIGDPLGNYIEISPRLIGSFGTGTLVIDADSGSENVQIVANLLQTPSVEIAGAIAFATNGEQITNTVNGRLDFLPVPAAANTFGVYMDFTSFTVGARMGVIRASDGVKNPSGSYIQYETQLAIVSDVNTVYGNNAECVMRVTTTGNDTFQIAPSVAAGRSAAIVICNQSHVGAANRSPATAHVDPTFYVYSSDGAQALDYVRISHNQTDAVIETGAGNLNLVSAADINNNGNRIPKIFYGSSAPGAGTGTDGDLYFQHP